MDSTLPSSRQHAASRLGDVIPRLVSILLAVSDLVAVCDVLMEGSFVHCRCGTDRWKVGFSFQLARLADRLNASRILTNIHK